MRQRLNVVMQRPGYVYAIKYAPNVYKFGYTTNLERRLKQLEREAERHLEIFYSAKVVDCVLGEKMLHNFWCEERLRGELFYIPGLQPDMVEKTLFSHIHMSYAD